jgi:hypothetical protein
MEKTAGRDPDVPEEHPAANMNSRKATQATETGRICNELSASHPNRTLSGNPRKLRKAGSLASSGRGGEPPSVHHGPVVAPPGVVFGPPKPPEMSGLHERFELAHPILAALCYNTVVFEALVFT